MSIMLHNIHVINSFAVLLSSKSMVRLLLLLAFGLTTAADHAQTVKIKLVDGRNGRPMASIRICVWVGNKGNANSGLWINTETDKTGSVDIRLTPEHVEDKNETGVICGGSVVINPVFEFGDTISISSYTMVCQRVVSNESSWLNRIHWSTEEALKHGVVTPNACGKATASPTPGELVFFVRPLTWLENLQQ
ncbi:MAG: hypothetical protein J2P52_08845 [Blastocatellia bacterium]|nr:hypothetical protein [Blastocatellia bacterium]